MQVVLNGEQTLSFLRMWRKSSRKTQAQLASLIGENHKTYSAYERGASPVPPEILSKLRSLGYSGPASQRLAPEEGPVTREDFAKGMADLRRFLERQLSIKGDIDALTSQPVPEIPVSNAPYGLPARILPEHVQEAWAILSEAIEKTGAELRFIDRKSFGLLLGLTAEQIAWKGFSDDTRASFREQAEKFVRTASKPR